MRRRQQGMGYIGYIMLAVIIGFLVKIFSTCSPPYIDFHSLDAAIQGSINEAKGSNPSITDLQKSISTHLQVEGVTLQSKDDLVISKDGNTITAVLKYDVQRPFIANVDLVFHFNKTYSSSEASSSN
jgi:hypothetical protein